MNSINIFSPDTVLTAGGWMLADSTQTLYKTYNGGLLWDVYIDTNALWLKSVDFLDAQNGFAVGAGGRILKSTDAGVHWSRVSAPINRDFNRIFFIDSMIAFIAGGKQADSTQTGMQTMLKSVNGGTSWTTVYDQNGSWLKSVYFISSSLGYAVGDNGTILKTINTGNTWTPIASPIQRDFNSIWFSDTNNGIIVGGNFSNDSIQTILRTTNGGNNWTIYQDALGGWLTDVYFLDADTGYAVGDKATLLKTTDAGQTWIRQMLGGTTGDEHFNAVRFHSWDYGVIAGKLGSEYFYTRATVPEAHVLGSELIDSAQVLINGIVNTHGQHGTFSVVYSLDSLFQNPGQTYRLSVNSNGFSGVQFLMTSLDPNTVYKYLMKASTLAGSAYSDTLSFFTGALPYAVTTLPATDVTNVSAQLNGTIKGFSSSMNLFFQYGDTPDFGNQVGAIPFWVNDTMLQTVSAIPGILQPNTLYFFRLKAVAGSGAGTFYGDTYPFFTGNGYTNLQALNATNIMDSSVTLNGLGSGFKLPTTIIFELSTDNIIFYQPPFSMPHTIDDSLTHLVIEDIGSLNPATLYFFRLKATNISGTAYSDTISFITKPAYYRTITLTASEVTESSAQLNGTVKGFTEPVNLSFQYGSTISLNNEIQAIPSSINDTSTHHISAIISGLLSDTLYYYRIKAETNSGSNFYGAVRQVYVGTPSIPNWDFQYWDEDTTELLYRWFVASDFFEKVPGHSGNHAIKLYDQNLLLLGKMKAVEAGGPVFYDGVPFAARPDSVIAWFQYDNLPDDSSTTMIIALRAQGNIIAQQNCFVSGSTSGIFERKAFKIDYSSPFVPDSLVIAFFFHQLNNSITIDDISFSPSAPAVTNSDFETWFLYSNLSLQSWHYLKYIMFDSIPGSGLSMVTQAFFEQPLDYAAEIRNVDIDGQGSIIYGNISTVLGFLGAPTPSFPVYARHESLNGYFQYYPDNGDSMSVLVIMTKNGQVVGQGRFIYGDSSTLFQSFDIPIIYNDASIVPDSAIISISSSNDITEHLSRLLIDKLSFDGLIGEIEVLQILEQRTSSSLLVYPNPVTTTVTIKFENPEQGILEIIDLKGMVLLSRTFSGNNWNIETSALKMGIYLLRVYTSKTARVHKIVVIN